MGEDPRTVPNPPKKFLEWSEISDAIYNARAPAPARPSCPEFPSRHLGERRPQACPHPLPMKSLRIAQERRPEEPRRAASGKALLSASLHSLQCLFQDKEMFHVVLPISTAGGPARVRHRQAAPGSHVQQYKNRSK